MEDKIFEIRNMYGEHHRAERAFAHEHNDTVEHYLPFLEEHSLGSCTLEAFIQLEQSMPTISLCHGTPLLAEVLAYLPPYAVREHLGNEAVHYTWARLSMDHAMNDSYAAALSNIRGIDITLLVRAQAGVEHHARTNDIHMLEHAIKLHTYLAGDGFHGISVQDLINQMVKHRDEWSGKREEDYSIAPLFTEWAYKGYEITWGNKEVIREDVIRYFNIYIDAPTGLGLMFSGEPQAVVSFTPVDNETVLVLQLQGISPTEKIRGTRVKHKGNAWALAHLDWEQLMISAVESVAQETGYSTIGMQSAQNNHWTRVYDKGSAVLPIRYALKRYDETAKRLGFSYGDDGNLYKPLAITLT